MEKEQIATLYKEYFLEFNAFPKNVYKFAHYTKLDEQEFYQYFSSLEHVEGFIWETYFENTEQDLSLDPSYNEYSGREKMMAFYYTLLQTLKKDRTFNVACLKRPVGIMSLGIPVFLKTFRKRFESYSSQIIADGTDTGEIKARAILSARYKDAAWLSLLFVLRFWANDNSEHFERTDIAVERAVQLAFDLMAPNPLDSGFDLARFLLNR